MGISRFSLEKRVALCGEGGIDKMNADLVKALDAPKLRQKLEAQGLTLQKSTPAQADKYIASEHDKWARVIKASNMAAE